MLFPWLFDEAKGAGQPFAAATHQAARAGASAANQLVEPFSKIHEEIANYQNSHQQATFPANASAKKNYHYVDGVPLAMVFSLAVGPHAGHLSIHFEEHHDADMTYYRHQKIYLMTESDDIKQLRMHINNILDWGMTSRKEGLEERFAKYFEKIGLAKKAKEEEHSGGDGKATDVILGTE
ncbi:MAG: hypothetical protein Q9182_006865 [Xanthomendoza sp. 2 TL-2023]